MENDIPGGGDTRRFIAVVEKDPPPIFEESFDADGPELPTGWTSESYLLPPSAAGQSVKVVFEFATAADGFLYKGFYFDDVMTTAN